MQIAPPAVNHRSVAASPFYTDSDTVKNYWYDTICAALSAKYMFEQYGS